MEDDGGYNWAKEVREFEEARTGVKGLVDAGVKKIPRFFIHPPASRQPSSDTDTDQIQPQIPIIDLRGIEGDHSRRMKVVDQIRQASETWGIFQMVNHGVPAHVVDSMLQATRKFHEQPAENKRDLYSSDGNKKVRFYTINGSFEESDVANWRDALSCSFQDDKLHPELIPSICREEMGEYVKYMIEVREMLSELLSEALGMNRDFLSLAKCMKSEYLTYLYYPACPEPNLTFGTNSHSDATFLTILAQDTIGGLQLLHHNHWVDVPPLPGALIANIGDLMQLITNDKFKSAVHRVLARSNGPPRTSVACFYFPSSDHMLKPYGPIKELTSEDNPPLYKQVSLLEYTTQYQLKVRNHSSSLLDFKL